MKFVLPAYQWFGIINEKREVSKHFAQCEFYFLNCCFCDKLFLPEMFAKFTGKHLCQSLFFNPFSTVILWKIDIKSNPTLNGYNAKTRTNLKSKLKSSESSLSFLQNSIIFCVLYPRRCTAGGSAPYNPRSCCQRLTGLKELIKLPPEACNFI